jgi:hypothetical protein
MINKKNKRVLAVVVITCADLRFLSAELNQSADVCNDDIPY